MGRLIFHIDVNSAYLFWEAAYRLQQGEKLDLRTIPSVVGGDETSRHGIVLAKSIPAKKYSIKTGETLQEARRKCPEIVIVPPRYWLYMQCSSAMNEILQEYTPTIQRFSVDESLLDFSNMENLYPDYMELAETIRERIKVELGFTVNIGISNNKLLVKVASDLEKPDRIHTLFLNEIRDKMWPLPIVVQLIEAVSYTDNKGNIKPLRFRLQKEDESRMVIKLMGSYIVSTIVSFSIGILKDIIGVRAAYVMIPVRLIICGISTFNISKNTCKTR